MLRGNVFQCCKYMVHYGWLECAGNKEEQNQYYNGRTCNHYVNAVLAFCPDGAILVCCYNVPGTVHDSKIALLGKSTKIYTQCTVRQESVARLIKLLQKTTIHFSLSPLQTKITGNLLVHSSVQGGYRSHPEWTLPVTSRYTSVMLLYTNVLEGNRSLPVGYQKFET